MATPVRLVLFAHGSHDPQWRAPFERLASTARRQLGNDRACLAYMEFVRPTLEDVAGEAVRDGVKRLVILPLFMAAGGHVARDIPSQAGAVAKRYTGLEVTILPPVGEDPRFFDLLLQLAREAVEG